MAIAGATGTASSMAMAVLLSQQNFNVNFIFPEMPLKLISEHLIFFKKFSGDALKPPLAVAWYTY